MVKDDSGHVLVNSVAGTESAFQTLGLDVRPDADSLAGVDRVPYVSSTWPILLDEVFAAPTWNLVLAHSHAEVMGPVVRFTDTLLIVVLVSLALVLVLSVHRIRKSLVPLRELQEGTRRIAGRDFGSRVSIRSRDEFEELGASFNAMAIQLDRQFQALATAAEIDRAVLSATSASEIVATLLARLRDVYPCGAVSVTLMAPDGAKSLPSLVHNFTDDSRMHVRVDLRSDDVQELLDGPDSTVFLAAEGDRPPALRGRRWSSWAATCSSCCRSGSRASWSASSRWPDTPRTPADADARMQVRRLADQAAVALANARMLEQVRTPGLLRQPHRTAQSALLQGAAGERAGGGAAGRDGCSRRSSSTSTTSAGSTIASAMRPATSCSSRWRPGSGPPAAIGRTRSAPRGRRSIPRWPGWAVTSSPSSCRDSTDPEDAGKLARRILSSLAHPFRIERPRDLRERQHRDRGVSLRRQGSSRPC